jgi:hypothetical protein
MIGGEPCGRQAVFRLVQPAVAIRKSAQKTMTNEINEILAAKSNGRPGLISAEAKELLNLRRLPAMLNTAQTAVLLGLAEHDIPVLVRTGLLKPLGTPPPNAVKSFSTTQVLELAGEIALLNKIRNTVYHHWRGKNADNAKPSTTPPNTRRPNRS